MRPPHGLGLLARQKLAALKDAHPKVVEEIRGEGLMIGVKVKMPPGDFAALARHEKLLTIPAGDNTVRLVPPLIISDEELSEAVRRLDEACRAAEASLTPAGKAAAA